MANWSQRVCESPARLQLDEVLTLLDEISPDFGDETEEGETIRHLRYIVYYSKKRLLTTDHQLVGQNALNQINSQLHAIFQEVSAFRSNRDVGHLQNANHHAEELIVKVSQAPLREFLSSQHDVNVLVDLFEDEVNDLRATLRHFSARIREDTNTFSGSLAELSNNSRSQLEQLETTIQETIGSFSERASGLQAQIADHVRRLDESISRNNDQFARGEEERVSSFNSSQNKWQNQFRSLFDGQAAEGERLIGYLKQTADNAEQILGITAASATAGAYLSEADRQKRQADGWRWGAVAAFIVAGILGIALLIWPGISADGDFSNIVRFYLTRLTVVLGAVGLGLYLVRESGQHRNRERENKRLANELTTFRPFLAEITAEERNELVKQASERYFLGNGENH